LRLFLAVDLDVRARAAVASTIEALQRALGGRSTALRWTRPENAHITLHFLGDVPSERLPALRASLGEQIECSSFVAAFGVLGTFPARGTPKTVWISIARGAAEISQVHHELQRRLSEFGVATDPRPFSAHLTLARVRDKERRRVGVLGQMMPEVAVASSEWEVDRVTLYSSDLSGSAPRYTAVHRIALAPAGAAWRPEGPGAPD